MKYSIAHIIISALILLMGQVSYAQVHEVSINTDYDHEYGYEADVNTASTLNNALLFSNSFIDNSVKDENYNRLGDLNTLGTYVDMKLYYRQNRPKLFGVDKLGLYFALEWHYLDEYQFTQDVFSLIFYGNKDFAGRSAQLSNTGRQVLNYYQLKLGLQKISANDNHRFGANLSLNIGNRYDSYQFNDNSSLYTSPTGEELNLIVNVDYFESDSSKSKWYQTTGVGTGIDLYYEFQQKDKYEIFVSVENLGFIKWNKNSLNYSGNENITYSGIEVGNIFDIPNPLIQSNDTLMDYIYSKTSKSKQLRLTPVDMKLRYSHHFLSNRIIANAYIQYRLYSYMKPLFQLDAIYKINENIELGPILSYGGYTNFNAGLKLGFSFADYYQIRLETRYITGLAAHSFSGIGGFINFTYKI